MVRGSYMTPGSQHLVDEILHSMLFLGKINNIPFSPEEIFPNPFVLGSLMRRYPRPLKLYSTQLPRRSPFSCVLDMIVLQNNSENEEQIKQSLQDLLTDLDLEENNKKTAFVSSTICISQKSQTNKSERYCGVSMSTKGPNAGKIMIAASCLSKWHKYVSGAVMTYYPNTVQKDYFDGTIEVPGNIRCEAFCLRDGARMKPCRSCKNLFGLNTEDLREWPYGNCAEAESLSNLLENEREVETHVDEYSAEKDNRQRAEDEVGRVLRTVLQRIRFNWTGEFYNPEQE
ncbi:uncharacterized protein LOC113017366 [Astatotilapia calliptera]|nr:uncharacterized protein LOC113017366 [Astatotilapia calliptera]